MKISNIFLTLALSLITLNSFSGEITAPLGFTWGESKDDMIEKGVVFGECETRKLLVCVVITPLKSISFVDVMIAKFDKNENLVGVSMTTSDIKSDIYGSEGIDIYNDLKINISKLYGKPESYEYTGRSLFTKSDEFYQCLSYDGCGRYVSYWIQEGAVGIEIEGVGRGSGYLLITYESKEFLGAIDKVDSERMSGDLDAL
jgi:hypothetical protein